MAVQSRDYRGAMVRKRLRGLGLSIVASSLVACQTSGPPLPSAPMPTAWGGPEVFQLPRLRITSGMVMTTSSVCVSAEGTQRITSRLVGVMRDSGTGLTEARIEIDGKQIARYYYNDDGRIVHSQVDNPGDPAAAGPAAVVDSGLRCRALPR